MPRPQDGVVRRRVVVHGRVQGVAFRANCQRAAERLGVRGWVRNRGDGSVELAAEGAVDAVDQLVEWSRQGPSGAGVTAVDVADEPPVGESGFRITY
ncbi:MAG: acylphosphatase [Actinomycetota bacterium]